MFQIIIYEIYVTKINSYIKSVTAPIEHIFSSSNCILSLFNKLKKTVLIPRVFQIIIFKFYLTKIKKRVKLKPVIAPIEHILNGSNCIFSLFNRLQRTLL